MFVLASNKEIIANSELLKEVLDESDKLSGDYIIVKVEGECVKLVIQVRK